jgi:hypothetical protein
VTSNHQQLPPAMAQNQECKQEIKGQPRHNAHIDGGKRLSVIAEKRLPSLLWRLLTLYLETVD